MKVLWLFARDLQVNISSNMTSDFCLSWTTDPIRLNSVFIEIEGIKFSYSNKSVQFSIDFESKNDGMHIAHTEIKHTHKCWESKLKMCTISM